MNTRWIKDINVRPKTIKLLEENIVEKLHYLELGKSFSVMTPEEQATKVE